MKNKKAQRAIKYRKTKDNNIEEQFQKEICDKKVSIGI